MDILWMVLLAIFGVIILFVIIAAINTIRIKPPSQQDNNRLYPDRPGQALASAEKLSRMIQVPSVSQRGSDDLTQIYAMHKVLERLFPLVHTHLQKIDMDGALLFRWIGKEPSRAPILLMSHMDVVEATGRWRYEPFSGAIQEGRVWGRGTVDTKGSLCAMMEAVEQLLAEGFMPPQDVYIASSCNEEITGDGAVKTVEYLKQKGIRLDIVMDEGGAVMGKPMPGIDQVAAMVGVLEKGRANVRFTAHSAGGHASIPQRNTPIARLAAFVHKVETKRLFKRRWTPQVKVMYHTLAPMMRMPYRFILGNLWLFGPILKPILARMGGQAGAMIASTCVFTMAEGSGGANVVPESASVTANLRFMPFENMSQTIDKLARLAVKYRIEMELISGYDVCPAADTSTYAYRQLKRQIKGTFGDITVVPYIMLAGTDARHYTAVCDCVLRFVPLMMTNEQMKSAHAINENIDVDSLQKAVEFYGDFIRHYDNPYTHQPKKQRQRRFSLRRFRRIRLQ